MTECKFVTTPLNWNLKLAPDSSTEECEPTQYWQLIGNLIYLMITRSDLSYSVGLLSPFMQKQRDIQWIALSEYYDTWKAKWIVAFSTNQPQQFDSRGTQTPTGSATKPIEDQPLVSSPSKVEPSPRVARSNQPSLFRTQGWGGGCMWSHMAQEDTKGSGHSHQRYDSPLLQQHE